MATVHVENGELVVDVEGLDKLWTFRSRLSIPLQHVRGVTADPGIAREGAGLKMGGARVPGWVTAGSFRKDGEKVFWDVHDPARALVIELTDETYARLVVEVVDPRATADLVQRALVGG